MIKDYFNKMLELFGVARALIGLLSIGVAHNFAFMMLVPRELWSIVDTVFLTGITILYLFFLSGVLVLSVFTAQILGVVRSIYLGLWVQRLRKRHVERFYPMAKRNRYFDQVHRTIESRLAPTAIAVTWCLPIALIGYFYAGWLALVSLPVLMMLFLISVPILYPNLNFDITFIDGSDEERKANNRRFWTGFLSDAGTLKQLAAFVMSASILLSGYLGFIRHNYLANSAQFDFLHSEGAYKYSLIGNNAQGYLVFDSSNNTYLLISYEGIRALKPVQ